MIEIKSNHPFYNWVPRPIGIIILLLTFVPPTFSGGAYLTNIGEMSGGLGIWIEDIQLASFFTNIGMCLFPPFMIQFLQKRRIKQTYIYCFLALTVLNYICAETSSLPILLTACLITGIVRCIVILNCTFTIAPYLTGMDTLSMFTMTEKPDDNTQYILERKRTFLMPVLYTYILIIAQLSNMVTAWFAYNYHWRESYYVVIAMLLFSILLIICTMPDENPKEQYKPEWQKIIQMLFMTLFLCSMTIVLVYGKTMNWFNSIQICIAFAIMLISCGIFILLELQSKENLYLPLEVFKFRNISIAVLLFVLTMIFNSANTFVGTYAKMYTSISNLHSAFLSKWAILGCIIGLILSIILVIKKVKFRTIFIVALLFMSSANIYMYFQYQTMGQFSNMPIPTILNFTGLLMLYSLIAAFGMKSLPAHYLVTFVFLMIFSRNSIAPTIGSAIYSNWLQERQQYYITKLATDINTENEIAKASVYQSKLIGMNSGKSTHEAEQISITALKGKVTIQATLLAMKDITGKTIWLIFGSILLVTILPYHKNETT